MLLENVRRDLSNLISVTGLSWGQNFMDLRLLSADFGLQDDGDDAGDQLADDLPGGRVLL